MSRTELKQRIKQGLFLLDGAMGTELIARRIEPGKCNDYLNIESPDIIYDIHRSYFDAGSDAVLTNTFGANKFALARHNLSEKTQQINTQASQIARRAAGEQGYVLGDIGPSGDFLQPLGNLNPEELKNAFAEQAKALLAGGADGFIIETMTALEEITIAIEAVKSVCNDLPIFASMAFDAAGTDYRTMMGVDVKSAVSKIIPLGVDAVGFNCGSLNMEQYIELAKELASTIEALEKTRRTSHQSPVTILAEPNAGRPEMVEDKIVYKVTPEDFAQAVEKIHSTGFDIIGGCCGTGPAHIKAMAKRLKE